ncbi:MAG: four helix bundle protein [Gemmatimonadetes bacterium]|uniref:Four helix bundle protein n=1 Tax=Candidatus Kutchimonas denitrificans TaxID=3056748 RepID=A0AAE5C9R0_9BACT|nr:four helix bundle protein [Gemmatimonadota bacterium]NIR73697.1 four helix bundle protein [Candidatus Kutchimonas denitrificans]NIS00747.1 four helix bundle protein [Gemmatimonadota bacterium]NIT66334.1 four helix bundle protein [Gemmatimonadota bacterium]NIU51552.1 four helix bundle protein [Gemmatimonadota bacterium]
MKSLARTYDLRNRLIEHSVLVCRVAERLPSTRIGRHVAAQLLCCGTAPAAHHAEAQSSESRRDFIHKLKLGLKELREALVWLELTDRLGISDSNSNREAIAETDELIRILHASVATARRNAP